MAAEPLSDFSNSDEPKCIGIDDALPESYLVIMTDAASRDAERFADLFPELYLRLHTRRERGAMEVTPQMWGMLQHFALAGPLTIGEAARHFDRAQSVVSETVDALEQKGLVERMADTRDRRRTLVWLTDEAHAFMKRQRRVLDDERLALAMKAMSPAARRGLIEGMEALVASCDRMAKESLQAKNGKKEKEQ